MENTFKVEIESDLKNLTRLLNSVETFLKSQRIKKPDRYAILISIDEAVTNIIHHAYHGEQKELIKISCQIGKQQCIISIIDFGIRFNPTTISPPDLTTNIEQRKVGGLGIFLMEHYMDKVHYSFFKETGNQLVMIKKLKK